MNPKTRREKLTGIHPRRSEEHCRGEFGGDTTRRTGVYGRTVEVTVTSSEDHDEVCVDWQLAEGRIKLAWNWAGGGGGGFRDFRRNSQGLSFGLPPTSPSAPSSPPPAGTSLF